MELGRHERLKISWPEMAVRVRVPFELLIGSWWNLVDMSDLGSDSEI